MVGIVVAIGVLCLLYMSFKIGKFGALGEKGYEISVTLADAGGLDPRSPVQIAGVHVGRIKSIKLEGYSAHVTMLILQHYKVPVDSKVVIRTQGVLGDKFIEILPGKSQQFLAGGDYLKDVVAPPDFNEIFTNVGMAAKNFGETMDSIKSVLGKDGQANISKSLENIQVATGDFRSLVAGNKTNITRIVTNLENISSDIEKGKGTLGKLAKDDTLYTDAKSVVASLKTVSKDLEEGKGTIGKLVKDESLYNDAKEVVDNLKDVTEGFKNGEGTLGKLAKDDSLYTDVQKAAKKVQKGAEGLQEMTPVTILSTIIGTFF